MEQVVNRIEKTVRNWWVVVLFGVLFLLLGIWVLQTPAQTFVALSLWFAITYIISGAGTLVFTLSNRDSLDGWGWQFTGGVVELLLGIALLVHPGISMVALAFFVGFWLLFKGSTTISFALEARKLKTGGWGWILISGILSTILAFMVLVNPLYAASVLSIFIGFALIMMALAQILIGMFLRKISKTVSQ